MEVNMVDEQIDKLRSRKLLIQAAQWVVETPPYTSEFWDDAHYTGGRHLNTKGVALLRQTLRQEAHERSKGAMAWMAALTGLVGAMTGLIAVWPKG